MNLGCEGAGKAQERAQTLAHGQPSSGLGMLFDRGRTLTRSSGLSRRFRRLSTNPKNQFIPLSGGAFVALL